MKTHKTGDKEWIDDPGEFDEDRHGQEPGYSEPDKEEGCFGFMVKEAALVVAIVCLLLAF